MVVLNFSLFKRICQSTTFFISYVTCTFDQYARYPVRQRWLFDVGVYLSRCNYIFDCHSMQMKTWTIGKDLQKFAGDRLWHKYMYMKWLIDLVFCVLLEVECCNVEFRIYTEETTDAFVSSQCDYLWEFPLVRKIWSQLTIFGGS